MKKIHIVKYDVEEYSGWSSYFLLSAFDTKEEAERFQAEVLAGKLNVPHGPGRISRECTKPIYMGEIDISYWIGDVPELFGLVSVISFAVGMAAMFAIAWFSF